MQKLSEVSEFWQCLEFETTQSSDPEDLFGLISS